MRRQVNPSLLSHLRPLRNSKPVTGLEPSWQDDDPVIHSTIRPPWHGFEKPLETLEDYQRLLFETKTGINKNSDDNDANTVNNNFIDDDNTSHTYEVLNNYLSNNLEYSDIESVCSEESIEKKEKHSSVSPTGGLRSFGSVFEHIRMLPHSTSTSPIFKTSQITISSSSTNTNSSLRNRHRHQSGLCVTAKSVSEHEFEFDRSNLELVALAEQRNKNFQMLRAWTDDGKYSRVKAMTIASALYDSKVTENEIRADLTPKEKFAFKRFCMELEDKLQVVIKCDPLSDRTLRKIWHLYALYTKALSDEIWDEGHTNADITVRAISYLVKQTLAGPDSIVRQSESTYGVDWNQGERNKVKMVVGSDTKANSKDTTNPVLMKYLNDPINGFLIVYGRYVSTGKVNCIDKLRKLNFNRIAEDFFAKVVEPPNDMDEFDLLMQQQNFLNRCRMKQRLKHGGSRSRSRISIEVTATPSLHKMYNTRNQNKDEADVDSVDLPRNESEVDIPDTSEEAPSVSQPCPVSLGNNANISDMRNIQRKLQMVDGKKRICLVGCRYDVLPQVAKEVGFEVVGENDLWNINWSDTPLAPQRIMEMRRIQDTHSVFWGLSAPFQKTNHFPGMYEICRKDRLGRNLNRLKKMFPQDYNFFPPTWDLPTEQADLLAYARKRKNITFIVKPESGCQGKGIFLIRNLKNLYPFAKCVCQLYIPHPFLIDGYKFDQRIYVLITCVDPLRLYIYDEGIARFATVKYNVPTDENLEVVYMHLTNYSLNKFSESYVPEGDGSKRKMSSIYQWMNENGYEVDKLVKAIDEIVVKTLLCAAPTLKHNYKTSFPKKDRGCSCFELLGFDILVDRHLKPILLEVNHSPSFNLDLPVDAEVKTELLKDLLNMVYLGDELNAQAQVIQKKKRMKKHELSPPGSSAAVELTGLPKALTKQFQHEISHRGKFRLIYSSDKPGKYTKLVDENYCGYMAQDSIVKKKLGPVVFNTENDSENWSLRQTSSTMKMTKNGHVYVETRAVTPPIPSQLQRFREIPETELMSKNSSKHRGKISRHNSQNHSQSQNITISNTTTSYWPMKEMHPQLERLSIQTHFPLDKLSRIDKCRGSFSKQK